MYREHLVVLEAGVKKFGSCCGCGRLNAHLGVLGGSRGLCDPNVHGVRTIYY